MSLADLMVSLLAGLDDLRQDAYTLIGCDDADCPRVSPARFARSWGLDDDLLGDWPERPVA